MKKCHRNVRSQESAEVFREQPETNWLKMKSSCWGIYQFGPFWLQVTITLPGKLNQRVNVFLHYRNTLHLSRGGIHLPPGTLESRDLSVTEDPDLAFILHPHLCFSLPLSFYLLLQSNFFNFIVHMEKKRPLPVSQRVAILYSEAQFQTP